MRCAFVALALLPTALAAQPADTFGNAAGCDRVAGKPAGSDNVVILRPGSLEFWESACPITGATQVGAGAMVLTVSCSGEGETWDAYYVVETTSDPDTMILYAEDTPDDRRELKACK